MREEDHVHCSVAWLRGSVEQGTNLCTGLEIHANRCLHRGFSAHVASSDSTRSHSRHSRVPKLSKAWQGRSACKELRGEAPPAGASERFRLKVSFYATTVVIAALAGDLLAVAAVLPVAAATIVVAVALAAVVILILQWLWRCWWWRCWW